MSSTKHLVTHSVDKIPLLDYRLYLQSTHSQVTTIHSWLIISGSFVSAVFWPCESSTECNSVVATSFCNDEGYCECPAGHVFSSDVSVCLTESLHGEACQEGVQCSHMLTGAVCSSNLCTCREGLTYLQGRCRTLAPLHADCQVVSHTTKLL